MIYKSRSTQPIDWELVDSIIGTSQAGNKEFNISGVLLATTNHFLQVLKGSFEDVNQLYCTIIKDARHSQVQLISFSCTEERIFSSWTMHGIGVFGFNEDISGPLKEIYGEEDGEVRFPTDEWKALALIAEIRRSGG